MDFQGGISATILSDDTADEISAIFEQFPLISISEGIGGGTYLKFDAMNDEEFHEWTIFIEQVYPDARIEQIGEAFGKTLQSQALMALLFSFIGMSIVVTLVFRNIVPALAVIIGCFSDIAMTAAAMNILGIHLSLGTTAALLMLIAFSVDSDILLTTRILRRQGKFHEKIEGAFHTGFVMSTTTLGAIFAMWVVSTWAQITIISEMSAVLLIGLLFDLMNTWLTNAGILKWYSEDGALPQFFKPRKKGGRA
jgi:preprotein translocase subunit SecF